MDLGMKTSSNKPAAGNAGIASQLTVEHHWPGVPEPERLSGDRFHERAQRTSYNPLQRWS